MKNPLRNTSILQLSVFAVMMSYLLSATFVFISEFYFQYVQSNSVLPTTWFYKFVLRWHWVIIVVFITYTFVSYFIVQYSFAKLIKGYLEENREIEQYIAEQVKQIKKN